MNITAVILIAVKITNNWEETKKKIENGLSHLKLSISLQQFCNSFLDIGI